ncbi:hypothetical protein [Nocardioides coralli]|uniref:hypothetical protein n=1 Tax=Nocardioides coralli TaxID=2872154 RepID=UPI001CA401B9|nr:hypothetical protein [Nocardioides coralli]QZY30148.1 hypothetical protein K6T13_05560 [Nocardioides coralli]
MDFAGLTWHAAFVVAAVVLAPVGCLVSLGYALLIERRDSWRTPMLVTAVLGAVSILAAYVTGEGTLMIERGVSESQDDVDREYANQLALPTVGWLVVALVTGWVHPRTGALRIMLPMLLFGFALVVLVLTILAGDPDARSLLETITDEL